MNREPTTLGIVTALEMERRWIGRTDDTVLIEVGGMGYVRGEAAASRLIDGGASALVSWGVAGGLDPTLVPGTILVPEMVIGSGGEELVVDAEWRHRLVARIGSLAPFSSRPLLHSDEVVTTPVRKRELHGRWGAAAVDMESSGVARVAINARVPWLVIRVVGDAADHEMPRAVTNVADESGRLRTGAMLGLALRPGLWPALLALGRANAAAGRSMHRVWGLAGPDLAVVPCGQRRRTKMDHHG